jgi:adenosylhomocysteine nucleosidase
VTDTNNGITHSGHGDIKIQGAVGAGSAYYAAATAPHPVPAGQQPKRRADIGVITVLSVEMRAVCEMLSLGARYQKQTGDGGRRFYTAAVGQGDDEVRVVATQTTSPGQGPAMMAYEQLRAYCAPPVVVLCGIAGGIHSAIGLGDVVVARQVIYYDRRKEGADGIQRRGEAQLVPATILHAVNDMFTEHGNPMPVEGLDRDGSSGTFRAFAGPIGTGEAVIAHSSSEIRAYLREYNDKTLAVETEAGAVAQAFYEQIAGHSAVRGWLAVRGISDSADEEKTDAYHDIASHNAATVLERLLPYLKQAC